MSRTINLIPSGLKLIDKKWGGIYKGGSYLIIGQKKSGRTLLSLQFAKAAAENDQVCLYFTTMRPKDLIIQAASIGFDVQKYMNEDKIIVVRVAPPNEYDDYKNPDENLGEFFKDICDVVKDYRAQKPQRIVFDELTYYLGFNDLGYLQNVFLQTLEEIEDRDISSFYVVSEPATKHTEAIIDVIASNVTGIIYLKKSPTKLNLYYGGKIIITPNVGHTEGQFSEEYTIRPKIGIYVEAIDGIEENIIQNIEEEDRTAKDKINRNVSNESIFETLQSNSVNFDTLKISNSQNEINKENFSQFTNKFEIDLSKLSKLAEEDSKDLQIKKFEQPINLYEIDDFSLILNNQIALHKSTGQQFSILVIKLDPVAKIKGLINIEQLQNALISVTDKKDKLCVIDNKVIILIIRPTDAKINNIFSNFHNYLPSKQIEFIKAVYEILSFEIIKANEELENAEYVLSKIKMDEQNNKFTVLTNILK